MKIITKFAWSANAHDDYPSEAEGQCASLNEAYQCAMANYEEAPTRYVYLEHTQYEDDVCVKEKIYEFNGSRWVDMDTDEEINPDEVFK
jgi:hypothetical protein